MKLTTKEILRETNQIVRTWTDEFPDMETCLKYIQELDEGFVKKYFKFEYIIEE